MEKLERKTYPCYYNEVVAPFAASNVVGPFVFLSGFNGLTHLDVEKGIFEIAVGDAEAQVEAACQRIDAALKQAGTSWENVFWRTYYVSSYWVYKKAYPIMEKYFKSKDGSGTLVICGLAHPNILFEVSFIAYIPGKGFERKTYPSYFNGVLQPFASSNTVGPFVFLSGVNGLTHLDVKKGIYEIDVGNVETQTEVTFKRTTAALKQAGTSWENVFRGTYYVNSYWVYEKAYPIMEKYFKSKDVSSVLAVAGLAHHNVLHEFEFMAYIPEKGLERKTYPCYYNGVLQPFATSNVVGPFVFLSGFNGLTHLDVEKGIFEIAVGDAEAQVEAACQRIDAALKQAGTSWENVFRGTYYVTNYWVYEKAYPIMEKYFKGKDVSATLVVCGLAHPNVLIELEFMAYIP